MQEVLLAGPGQHPGLAQPLQRAGVLGREGLEECPAGVAQEELLAQAHDEFLPGTAYADWYDDERNLIRTALGPVK